MQNWQVILIASVVALTAAAAGALWMRRRDRKQVKYMLDALEDGELNFRFVEKNNFNRTLNCLRWILSVSARGMSRSHGPNSSVY